MYDTVESLGITTMQSRFRTRDVTHGALAIGKRMVGKWWVGPRP